MRTSNQEGDPIDFILTYLDQKKIDLVTDTRIDLLINRLKHDKKILERQAKNKALKDPNLDFLMEKMGSLQN